jgi:hypothetical protein
MGTCETKHFDPHLDAVGIGRARRAPHKQQHPDARPYMGGRAV